MSLSRFFKKALALGRTEPQENASSTPKVRVRKPRKTGGRTDRLNFNDRGKWSANYDGYDKNTMITPREEKEVCSSPSSNAYAGFMDLPGELRNHIYSLVLFPHAETVSITYYQRPVKNVRRPIINSPIFRLNRTVREEALTYLFATKAFHVIGNDSWLNLLEHIGPICCSKITKITLGIVGFNYNRAYVKEECDRYDRDVKRVPLLGQMRALKAFHMVMSDDEMHLPVMNGHWHLLEMYRESVEGIEGATFTWGWQSQKHVPKRLQAKAEAYLGKENYVRA